MIAAADRDESSVETLVELLDELEPSTDRSIPPLRGIRTLAIDEDDLEDDTIDRVIEEVHRLLEHDRTPVHRLAAVAAVVLVDRKPEAASPLLDRLVSLLEEEAHERRALETIEHVSTATPTAVEEHFSIVVEYLDHSRDAVPRHVAGILLSLALDSSDAPLEAFPRLLSSLAESFESTGDATSMTRSGTDVQSLERDSRAENLAARMILARAVAEVARDRPEAVADAVVESGTCDVVVSLFDDEQPRVRALATGIAAHVVEREPDRFERAVPRLLELLEDEHEVVRGGAIWTLRALDDPRAVDGLRRTSREDPSEDLRELATEAVRERERDRSEDEITSKKNNTLTSD
ncbi:HEAT repeat domain-containing protein [Halomontanus rarus]|uniref:HEAT repeat domain-containing protein n=1 Tax=Halomontanus rarus TaxID=3034020 RepID=UPI0023E8DE11|nr:HEAT repeat domain-containing protein [Halovivax sp. TS33]